MIVHDCQQGSDQWKDFHIGTISASSVDKIVTPKTRKPSTQVRGLVNRLVAELMTGECLIDDGTTQFMERGLKLEAQARADYAWDHDVDVQEVGFVTTDDGLCGGSPDGLIGDDGGLEIKVPGPIVHVGYMRDPQRLANDYHSQVQCYLWITERRWWDILSWNRPGGLPDVIYTVERDEQYIDALAEAVRIVAAEVESILVRFGYRPPGGVFKPLVDSGGSEGVGADSSPGAASEAPSAASCGGQAGGGDELGSRTSVQGGSA